MVAYKMPSMDKSLALSVSICMLAGIASASPALKLPKRDDALDAARLALPRLSQGPPPVAAGAGAAYGPPAAAPPLAFSGAVRIGSAPDTAIKTPGAADAAQLQDPVYGVRDIDLPFNRVMQGQMSFYRHISSPNDDAGGFPTFGPPFDSASQTACGIPSNAYWRTGVAIHPYWLKYVGLDRLCMQDVCIGMWPADGRNVDMIMKVDDICSTDPNDPTHCPTPMDLKTDRAKMKDMLNLPDNPLGDVSDTKVGWFFTKCWAEGLVQPAYSQNWYAQPPYFSSAQFSIDYSAAQCAVNNINYPKYNLPTYQCGANHQLSPIQPLSDWQPGTPDPAWSPIAGGQIGDQFDNAHGGAHGASATGAKSASGAAALSSSSSLTGNRASSSTAASANVPSSTVASSSSSSSGSITNAATSATSIPSTDSATTNIPSTSTPSTFVPAVSPIILAKQPEPEPDDDSCES